MTGNKKKNQRIKEKNVRRKFNDNVVKILGIHLQFYLLYSFNNYINNSKGT